MKALYHQFNRPSVTMHIVTDHKDGTVTLSLKRGGEPFVRCPLGEQHGQASLLAEPLKPLKPAKAATKVADPAPPPEP